MHKFAVNQKRFFFIALGQFLFCIFKIDIVFKGIRSRNSKYYIHCTVYGLFSLSVLHFIARIILTGSVKRRPCVRGPKLGCSQVG